MEVVVRRAGSDPGLTRLGVGSALRVGALVGWTTAASSSRDPLHRPIGLLWGVLVVVAGGCGWIVGGWLGAAFAAVVGFAGYFIVIMLAGLLIEPVLFRRATRVWLFTGPRRFGCAKATVTVSGAWRLTSVAAWPFGAGVGGALTEAVTADADQTGREVVLTAENRRVGALYRRFGFEYIARTGRRMVREARIPEPPAPLSPSRRMSSSTAPSIQRHGRPA